MTTAKSWIFSPDFDLNTFARKYGALIIVATALLLLIPGTGSIPLIDRDEPRFAEAAREMMEGGDWFVPYFNGNYRFDKPILTYWIMAPGLAAAEQFDFISLEMGSRIHSVITTILLGLTIFWMGRRWFSPRVGLLAGWFTVSCLQIVMHGRSNVADMPMVVCVALAQFALYELLHPENDPPAKRWFWILYAALGVGFLAKGPVTWLIPMLTLLLYRALIWRKKLPWRNLKLLQGLPLTLLIVGLWGIPALIRTGGLFWDKGMGEHVFERGFSTMAGFGHVIFYYLLTAFISLYPGIAYAGFGFQQLRRSWNSRNAFLVSWLAATYLFFSFYFTQLPHYVMPAFAAFFLLLGQIPADLTPRRWTNRWFWIVLAFPPVLAVIVILFSLIYPFQPPYTVLRPMFLAFGCGLIGMGLIGLAPRRGSKLLLALGILLFMGSLSIFGTNFRKASITVRLGETFRQFPADIDYISTGFNEPGIVFYSHRRWDRHGDLDDELKAQLAQPGPRVVVLLEKEQPLESFFQQFARDHFGSDCRIRQKDFSDINAGLATEGYQTMLVEGLNPARTSWATVRIFYRLF